MNDVADDDYDADYNIIIDDNNIIIMFIISASSLALPLCRFDTSSQFVYVEYLISWRTALYKI